MPNLPIIPTFVEGAWLTYTPEGAEKPVQLPLTRFTVKYALNQIPSAEVQPAIGFNIRKPSDVTSLTGLQENLQVKIEFSSRGENVLLMEGFVRTITIQEKATPFSRKASAAILISHIYFFT